MTRETRNLTLAALIVAAAAAGLMVFVRTVLGVPVR